MDTMIPQDVIGADYLLVFGNGVKEKYKHVEEEYPIKIIPVGSTMIERNLTRTVKPKGNDTHTILYITSNYIQNNLYIGFNPPFSDNLLYDTQTSLLDLFGELNGVKTVVKLHPSNHRTPPLPQYVNDKGYKNIDFVKNEYKLSDIVDIADVIVIDVPTTSLLFALTTDKPIFTLTTHLSIDPVALNLLKKRVHCFTNTTDITTYLNAYFQYPITHLEGNHDQDFLKEYGIHDGRSKEEVVSVLTQIINSTQPK